VRDTNSTLFFYLSILISYYSPELNMANVLAIGGPKSYMDSPKQLSLSPNHISASPYFNQSPESPEKQLTDSPSNWYTFFDSTAASPYHNFLHSSPFQALQQQQKSCGNILSQHYLTTQAMASKENLNGMPRGLEIQRLTAYPQSMSPFMALPDFKAALSSNGSTYCESDVDSLGPFDESFTAHYTDTHCGLVHPIPKSSVSIAANNIYFLSSSKDPPSLSSFFQDSSPEEPHLSSAPYQSSNQAQFHIGAPLSRTPSIHSPDAKPCTYDDASAWAAWETSTTTYGCFARRDIDDTTYDSSWHDPAPQNVPWIHDRSISLKRINGIGSGLPIVPSSHPSNALTTSSPLVYQFCSSTSVPQTSPAKAHPNHYLPSKPTYIASPRQVCSDPDDSSPSQKPLGSFSPSSFTHSTIEEGPPHRQTGEVQTRIEAKIHYSDERNAFLIDCKRRGLSYKDIKRIGGFKEAESTLRGRYRTLTKSKDQRVRKPRWQDKDVSYQFLPLKSERSVKLI
jgi:hypothetical protein